MLDHGRVLTVASFKCEDTGRGEEALGQFKDFLQASSPRCDVIVDLVCALSIGLSPPVHHALHELVCPRGGLDSRASHTGTVDSITPDWNPNLDMADVENEMRTRHEPSCAFSQAILGSFDLDYIRIASVEAQICSVAFTYCVCKCGSGRVESTRGRSRRDLIGPCVADDGKPCSNSVRKTCLKKQLLSPRKCDPEYSRGSR